MDLDVTSASSPARSRRVLPGVQRQRNASRHEAKTVYGKISLAGPEGWRIP